MVSIVTEFKQDMRQSNVSSYQGIGHGRGFLSKYLRYVKCNIKYGIKYQMTDGVSSSAYNSHQMPTFGLPLCCKEKTTNVPGSSWIFVQSNVTLPWPFHNFNVCMFSWIILATLILQKQILWKDIFVYLKHNAEELSTFELQWRTF